MGLWGFWRPRFKGESGESFEKALEDAVHRGGPKIRKGGRIRVAKIEGVVDEHSPWHITTYGVEVERLKQGEG